MTKVQIDEVLLTDLYKFHLLGIEDDAIRERIRAGLQAKADAQLRRQEYGNRLKHYSDEKMTRA